MMVDTKRLIFIHGMVSSGQGFKARLLRRQFPHILAPDFDGSLEERMAQLLPILGDQPDWTIIGSSFGGLMGALFTCQHPGQVRKLILLAPALIWPDFANALPPPVPVPTAIAEATAFSAMARTAVAPSAALSESMAKG